MGLPLPRIDWAFIQRLTRRATHEEARVVDDWLADQPHTPSHAEIDRVVQSLDTPLRNRNVAWQQAAWTGVVRHAHIGTRDNNGRRHPVTPPSGFWNRTRLNRWRSPIALGVFAATIAVIVVAIPVMRHTSSSPHKPPLVYTTGPGQRAKIELPDGTIAMLNVASRLDVPSDFANGNHAIRLDGQASFMVVHHDDVPLSVTTGFITTRVLGTKFMVRRYASDIATTVAVEDGKVSVGAESSETSSRTPVVVSAAQQLEIDSSGHRTMRPLEASQFAFETGTLSFTHTTLRDAIPELNRWYDVDIRLADPSLGNAHLTSQLTMGSASDLIVMLERTFDVRVERDNNTLTIYRR